MRNFVFSITLITVLVYRAQCSCLLESWTQTSGAARDIGVGANGHVWVIGTDKEEGGYGIHTYSPYDDTWLKVYGGGVRISVDKYGYPWIVNDQQEIHRMTPSGWKKLSGSAYDIGIGADNSVWVIGTDVTDGGYGIYQYDHDKETWTKVEGGAVRIAVDKNGSPWVVNQDQEIFRRTNNGWQKLPGAAYDIGVGADGTDSGTVWVIGTAKVDGGYGIYVYNRQNKEWKEIDGGATQIAVDSNGFPWVVNDANGIYRREAVCNCDNVMKSYERVFE